MHFSIIIALSMLSLCLRFEAKWDIWCLTLKKYFTPCQYRISLVKDYIWYRKQRSYWSAAVLGSLVLLQITGHVIVVKQNISKWSTEKYNIILLDILTILNDLIFLLWIKRLISLCWHPFNYPKGAYRSFSLMPPLTI